MSLVDSIRNNMKRFFSNWVAVSFFATWAMLPNIAYAQMNTSGQCQVNGAGAATYTIPLQISPGVAGLEPKIALNYSSQAGNGLLGVGWNLAGLGGVSRCPRTLAQDGFRGGVNYDRNDRYCLDGQRLIAVSGVDGGDGTEYRTELESFARIASYGAAGSGPASFKIWTKSGQIMYYGATDDSRVEVPGRSTVRIWALSRIVDTVGNYLAVSYTKDRQKGDYRPSRIDYTGTKNSAPRYAVQFEYEARTDTPSIYRAGASASVQMRLVSVKNFVSGTNALIRDYRLQYRLSTSSNRSLIGSITECSGDGKCFEPLVLGWQNGATGFSVDKRTYQMPEAPFKFSWRQFVDMDGDGIPDLVAWNDAGSGLYVVPGTGDGNFDMARRTYSTGVPFNWTWRQLIDMNGDGIPDLVAWNDAGSGLYVVPGTGDGNFDMARRTYSTGVPFNWTWRQLIDMNGDGIPDLVTWNDTGNGLYFVPGVGDGSFDMSRRTYSTGTPFNWAWRQLIDMNGDGIPDLVAWNDTGNGLYVVPGVGDGTFDMSRRTYSTGTPFNWAWRELIDMNGDGIPDFVAWNDSSNGIYVIPGTGDGNFDFDKRTYSAGTPYNWNYRQIADIDGDGLPDLMLWNDAGSGLYTVPGSINGGFDHGKRTYYAAATPFNWPTRDLADVNGDGFPDLVLWGNEQSGLYTIPMSGTWPDLMIAVSRGANQIVGIDYQSIALKSGSRLYAKDAGVNRAKFPIGDMTGALYVAASVKTSNGAGDSTRTAYSYGGLKADMVTGRGLLGFRWMQMKQMETGLVSYTEYQQNWPYVGLPSLVKKSLANGGNGGVLSQTTTSYGCNDPSASSTTACTIAPGKRYFVYAKQSVENSWDYNGTALPVITTSSEYDNWGNAMKVEVATDDGFKKSTVNTYANDSVNWYLG
ncbi:hypothetical protein FEE59_25365, partial [Herbaspirillum sp. RU 5E]|nr:hypothetical protein [Herbaspirillum sp. RU 5E]